MGTIQTGIFKNNLLINGGFHFWQRGTSISVAANSITYAADRWSTYSVDNSYVVTQAAATAGIPGFGFKIRRNTGQTGTNSLVVCQDMESLNSVSLTSKTVTLSFRAKAGANFSASGNVLNSRLSTGTGTDQKRINGLTGQVDFLQANTLTTSFQTFTYTVTLGSGINQVSVFFTYAPTGTAGADDSVTIESVMLNEGSITAPFYTFGKDYGDELKACQRYYEKSYDLATAPATATTASREKVYTTNTMASDFQSPLIPFKSPKRGTPTVRIWSNAGTSNRATNSNTNADLGASSAVPNLLSFRGFNFVNSSGGTQTTANQHVDFQWDADSEI